MEGKLMKDTTLTLRAQQIIATADEPINVTDALVEALRERGLSYDDLLKMVAGQISTRSLRKSTYELPEQDGLFDLPSIICIGTTDGDLFLKADKATVGQVEQWAEEAQQHHSTQNLRFKRFKKQVKKLASVDRQALFVEARAALIAGGDN
jgi:hypothetical protein